MLLSSLEAIMPKVAFRITLSDEERATLEGIVRQGKSEQRIHHRTGRPPATPAEIVGNRSSH